MKNRTTCLLTGGLTIAVASRQVLPALLRGTEQPKAASQEATCGALAKTILALTSRVSRAIV